VTADAVTADAATDDAATDEARPSPELSRVEQTVFACLSALNLVPIWAFQYFPAQDAPNHLYTVEVMRLLLAGTAPPALAAAFAPALGLKSNLLFHLLMLGLGRLGLSLETAHRLVLSAYALAFPLAGLYCIRAANRRASPLALLFLPLVFSWFVLQGLYNYVLSLPPALVWLGIVARDGGRPGRRAQLALGLAALAVYFGHAGTFVAMLLVTLVRVLRPGDGSRVSPGARLARALPLALALAPAFALAVTGLPGLLAPSAAPEPTVSGLEGYGVAEAAGAFFVEFAMRYHIWELAILGPPLVALIAIPLFAWRRRRTGAARPPRWPLEAALILVALYFVLPHIFHGSDVSPRLRPLIVFCLACYAGVALTGRARRRIVALALSAGIAGVGALCWDFAHLNRELRTFTAAIPLVRDGSRLYPMVFDPRGASILVRPFLHAWGYYGTSRHVVSPFAFGWHESRFPFRYRQLPLHDLASRLPSDGEDEPYALEQGRLCAAARRLAPSLTCADVRADAERRLARLGASYDYLLTWAAPADFLALLGDRGYRLLLADGALALYESPGARL
jgi:hypothetical protein